MRTQYKLPSANTLEAKLLIYLLEGNIVNNQQIGKLLYTAHPTAVMSKLLAKGWKEVIKMKSVKSGSQSRVYKEYWIDSTTISNLEKEEIIKELQ